MPKIGENPEPITSRANERVKQLAALLADPAERRERGLCVAPGLKLCEEAATAGLLRELWVTERAMDRQGARIERLLAARAGGCEAERGAREPLCRDEAPNARGVDPEPDALRLVVMSEPVADRLSDQKTPQGVVGVACLPSVTVAERDAAADWLRGINRVLALCGVQDPVNVGGALRTAAALGYAVAFGPTCADPFSPKALRASMGAAFRAKTARFASECAFAAAVREAGLRAVAAALIPGAVPITEIGRATPLALFIGNEGNGLDPQTVAACGCAAIIPITGRVESLNAAAAAAIAMWELRP